MVMSVVAWAALASGATPARAAMSLIRDAEIENTIHDLAAPLLRAADLDADAFNIELKLFAGVTRKITHHTLKAADDGLKWHHTHPTDVIL